MSVSLRRLVPGRVTVVALLTLAVTVALFAPTVVGFVSYEKVLSGDVGVDSMAVSEDGSHLVATMTFSNPTQVPVTVTDAGIYVRANRTLVNSVGGIEVDETTVPPGETGTFEVRLPLLDGQTDRARNGLASDTVTATGEIVVDVRGEDRQIQFEWVTDR